MSKLPEVPKTQREAAGLALKEWWLDHPEVLVFAWQLGVKLLCMPFGEFHRCAEVALGRPVFTHEFANPDRLRAELLKERPTATAEEVIAELEERVGKERVIVVTTEGGAS